MPRGHKLSPATREEIAKRIRSGESDNSIGRDLGLASTAIARVRRSFGLPTNFLFTRFFATPEQLKELMTTSDREMQRRYGVNNDTWARVRRDNGIPRFRAPTNGPDAKAKTPKKTASNPLMAGKPYQSAFSKAPRDHSLTGEAADFLRTERWVVINRAKVYGDEGWNVGRMRLTTDELVAMAIRKGFVAHDWMGVAA
jgi:hypothetical protein